MTPVYISGCFGVLHPAAGRRGVLICSTMGDEALNVYRPLCWWNNSPQPARRPCAWNIDGAGDSGGEDGEPARFQAWLNGIAAGVRWLRETCGVGPVTLVGVRAGAVLAARAACDIDDIEALVLLSPVPSGRRFLREMILRANTTAEIWQVKPRIEEGHWFEAHGLRLDRSTRDALERLDLELAALSGAARFGAGSARRFGRRCRGRTAAIAPRRGDVRNRRRVGFHVAGSIRKRRAA